MNEESKALLRQWDASVRDVDQVYDKYSSLIDLESDLMKAVFRMQSHYTDCVARILAVDVEWLYWWAYECQWGETPMQAIVDGKEYECDSLDVLIEILEADG